MDCLPGSDRWTSQPPCWAIQQHLNNLPYSVTSVSGLRPPPLTRSATLLGSAVARFGMLAFFGNVFASFLSLEDSISEQKLPFARILENNRKIKQCWNITLSVKKPLYSNTTTQHRRLVGSVKIITRAKNLSSLVSFKTTSLNWISLVMRDFRHSWLFSTTDASGVE